LRCFPPFRAGLKAFESPIAPVQLIAEHGFEGSQSAVDSFKDFFGKIFRVFQFRIFRRKGLPGQGFLRLLLRLLRFLKLLQPSLRA
jgi:hypothetical protein